jgi:hypothetical protein
MRANDTQCAECDDGGELFLCDGTCMRSFHINHDADGAPTACNPMGMPKVCASPASLQI